MSLRKTHVGDHAFTIGRPCGNADVPKGCYTKKVAAMSSERFVMETGLARPRTVTGLRRILFVALGLFFLALAIIGVVTPLLPTTPFLLLSSYFFARSSAWWHNWLLRSRLFGGMIRDWQQHRGVRPRVKFVALTLLPLVVFTSWYFGNLPWYLGTMLVVLATIGAIVVIRLPLVRDPVGAAEMGETRDGGGGLNPYAVARVESLPVVSRSFEAR